MNVGHGGTGDDQPSTKKRSYTSRSCSFCARRHIKCTGTNPCSNCQRRGIRCEYTEKVTKRGPKPGTTRDSSKQKLKQDEIAKIVDELGRQRQLSDYWRNKYIDVHSFAATVVKDPQTKLLVESSVGSDATPLLTSQHDAFLSHPRNPIIFEAVNSFIANISPAMPNVFVYDAEKIYEWFVYNITPPQLCEPFDSFIPDKMAEGALISTVFAHGCRLRGSEDRAVQFLTKSDSMLKEILTGPHGGITGAAMATVVLSTILLQIAFYGATAHVESIQWLLDQALQVLTVFRGSIDPLISQRVYLQLVATRPSPVERWALFESALTMDSHCMQDRTSANVIREAFLLSNRAVMCFVFSPAIDWFALDENGPFKMLATPALPTYTKYLDDTEQAIQAYEAFARATASTYHNADLLNAYRLIIVASRAGLYLSSGSDVNVVLLFINKAFEFTRAIQLANYPPFLYAALSFVNVVKIAKYLKQQPLFDEGVTLLSAMAKFYPLLITATRALMTHTAINLTGNNATATPLIKEEGSNGSSLHHLLTSPTASNTGLAQPGHVVGPKIVVPIKSQPSDIATAMTSAPSAPAGGAATAASNRAPGTVTPPLPSAYMQEVFTQFSPVTLRAAPGFAMLPGINGATSYFPYAAPGLALQHPFALMDPLHLIDPSHSNLASSMGQVPPSGQSSPSSSSSSE